MPCRVCVVFVFFFLRTLKWFLENYGNERGRTSVKLLLVLLIMFVFLWYCVC